MNNYLHWCLLEEAKVTESVTLPASVEANPAPIGNQERQYKGSMQKPRNKVEYVSEGTSGERRSVLDGSISKNSELAPPTTDLLARNLTEMDQQASDKGKMVKSLNAEKTKSQDLYDLDTSEPHNVADDEDAGRASEIITRKEKGANLERQRRKSLAAEGITAANSIYTPGSSRKLTRQSLVLLEQQQLLASVGHNTLDTAKDGNVASSQKSLGRVLSQADVFEKVGRKGSTHIDACGKTYASAAASFVARRATRHHSPTVDVPPPVSVLTSFIGSSVRARECSRSCTLCNSHKH